MNQEQVLQELQNDKNELLNTNYDLQKALQQSKLLVANVCKELGVEANQQGLITLDAIAAKIKQLKGEEFEEVE